MRYQYNRVVSNLGSLRAYLASNGYSSFALFNNATTLWVDILDNSPDPTTFVTAFVEPPTISAASDHSMGPFMHYQGIANGSDVQTITIQMLNPDGSNNTTWGGNVLVQPLSPVQVSQVTVAVVNGVGTFTVGPTTMPGEYDLYMLLQGDNTGYSWYRMHLSFF